MPVVDLAGVGLNATDTLIHLQHYPARGAKGEYRGSTVLPGGQVASTVIACAQWGLRTRYVGKLGEDEAARLHRGEFERLGVEAQILTVPGGASAQSLIFVDGTGERTVLNRRDDALIIKPEELSREWVVNARALHVDGWDTDAAIQAARWAREAGVPVIADLDELYNGIEQLVPLIDYLIVSRDFPNRFTGEADLEFALRRLQRESGCKLAAATLGEHGVLAWDGSRFYHSAAYNVPVVDTTGAGDVFHAGYIFALLQGWPLERQLDFACAAAAINCTGIGARGGIQSVERIEELMATGERHDAAEFALLAR
ncbi:carbohydrate kinase family protein [Silvibacterium sp.]|uniref:carbohydrate kinase family protein n=1 Tax=Silvibacterium sp. TaxID=1964179 RepID=UPI0039E681E0